MRQYLSVMLFAVAFYYITKPIVSVVIDYTIAPLIHSAAKAADEHERRMQMQNRNH